MLYFPILIASFSTFIFSNSLFSSISSAPEYLAIFSVSFLSVILSTSVSPDFCFTSLSLYISTFFLLAHFLLNMFLISDIIFSNWITSLLHLLLILGTRFCLSVLLLFSLSFSNFCLNFTCLFWSLHSFYLLHCHLLPPMYDSDFWLSISMGFLFFFSMPFF